MAYEVTQNAGFWVVAGVSGYYGSQTIANRVSASMLAAAAAAGGGGGAVAAAAPSLLVLSGSGVESGGEGWIQFWLLPEGPQIQSNINFGVKFPACRLRRFRFNWWGASGTDYVNGLIEFHQNSSSGEAAGNGRPQISGFGGNGSGLVEDLANVWTVAEGDELRIHFGLGTFAVGVPAAVICTCEVLPPA